MWSALTTTLFAAAAAGVTAANNDNSAAPDVLLKNAADSDVYMPVAGLGTGCNIGGCDGQHPMNALNMSLSWFQLGGRRVDGADSYGIDGSIGLAVKQNVADPQGKLANRSDCLLYTSPSPRDRG